MKKNYIIAIDGPSATGKSCTAKLIANKLSITYVDTGSMYRACAYYFITNNIEINEDNVCKHIDNINIKLEYIEDKINILLNDKNITSEIRTPEISMGAANVSKISCVRKKLVEIQRNMSNNKSLVMDGRDIGSVVFPNADLKVYLDADCKIRAKRRKKDFEKIGNNVPFKEVLHDTKLRDYQDMNRKNSPLIKTDDAIEIDTTNMSVEQVVDYIILLLKAKEII